VDELVAKRHDLRQVRYAGGHGRIQLGQLVECFANDFKFALYRRLGHGVGAIGCCIHALGKRLNGGSRLAHIPQKGARVTLHTQPRGGG